jgi:3-dehydroquinate synthase class II
MSVLERPATGDPSGRGAAFASPEAGDELDLPDVAGRLVVAKVGRAPVPGERRPCAFLLPLV